MIYEAYVPPPPLDRFIQNLWYWDGGMLSAEGGRVTAMASGRMSLFINLHDAPVHWFDADGREARSAGSVMALQGVQSERIVIDASPKTIMGCQFHPGGAYPFFAPDAQHLRDGHIALEDLWSPAAARALHGRLLEAKTITDKFRILLHALLRAMPRDPVRHPAVGHALSAMARAPFGARVSALAVEADLSDKRFAALFARETGVTPKLYLRMARFQSLLETIWDRAEVDWAECAHDFGYYDQAHLIRDFRQFSGFTPTQYWRLRGPYMQHVPVPD